MTFDEWWENRGKSYSSDFFKARQAYQEGQQEAARECLAIIGNQYPWLTHAIAEKFGL